MTVVKNKLAYEWKNMYRSFTQAEARPKGFGRVTFQTFQQALNRQKVFLSNEELKSILKRFEDAQQPGSLNYCTMSRALDLHSNALELIRPTTGL